MMVEHRGRVDGKVAIVTGAGSTPGPGVATGRATAIVMAREGARVLVADIRPDRAEETRELIESEGGSAAIFVGDMTNAADCEAMVGATLDAFGAVDILVNNIGAAIPGNVVDTSEDDFDRILDVSLRTTFLASKYAVPVMATKGSGAIVNIGSISGFRGGNYLGYAAAKGGVHALTVDMAYSHGRQGIRVNAVAPGHITTPLLFANVGQTPETHFRQRLANASGPLGTEGNGWDVAWAATFLASDEARWITGVTLPVDAGVMSVTPLMMAPLLREIRGTAG
jgi:NAD(P)-dependent dehydrogenase (short-subunit alcohol dehydrogenase family)